MSSSTAQPSKFLSATKSILLAFLIGAGLFFAGVFIACISPIVALLSLVYRPQISFSTKFKDWEQKLKEMEDPDFKEKWKKDHEDLYNEDNSGE